MTVLSKDQFGRYGECLRMPVSKDQLLEVCKLDSEALSILESTSFNEGQSKFNPKRGIKVLNIINSFFRGEDFEGKRIIELGPGHYAFALIARKLGAEVICIERDKSFQKLGQHLGFQVYDLDFLRETSNYIKANSFDGLWGKNIFNSCNFSDYPSIQNVVYQFNSYLKENGWAWMTCVNKSSEGQGFVNAKIDAQKNAYMENGWDAISIEENQRSRFGLSISGCKYMYVKNLSPKSAGKSSIASKGRSGNKTSKALCNDLNVVQRVWKPTSEYYTNPWQYFVDFIDILKKKNAVFITMSDAFSQNFNPKKINIILDHHIDFYAYETEVMARWESQNDVISSIYLFNRFEYSNRQHVQVNWCLQDLNIGFYQELEKLGFEIGYHQNAVGLCSPSKQGTYKEELSQNIIEKSKKIFSRDVKELREFFDIRTFIPHGAGENNAQLTDIPSELQNNLIWAYNNANSQSIKRPKWSNFSDSCGSSHQRIKGFKGEYIAHVDNLHMAAFMSRPGLNHILIHPGRFAKGMPYSLLDCPKIVNAKKVVQYEFELNGDDCDNNIDSSKSILINAREAAISWQRLHIPSPENYDISSKKVSNSKVICMSDNSTELTKSIARNSLVTPILVIHRGMSSTEKLNCKVPRPVSKIYPRPNPQLECPENAFRKHMNYLYTKDILHHVLRSKIPVNGITLLSLVLNTPKDIENLIMLVQLPSIEEIRIYATYKAGIKREFYEMIRDQQLRAYIRNKCITMSVLNEKNSILVCNGGLNIIK